MTLDVTFEEQPWEQLLEQLAEGETITATTLLACLEGATEEEAEEVLQTLLQRHVQLNIADLPKVPVSDASAQRLRFEETLVRQPDMLSTLEQNDPLRL